MIIVLEQGAVQGIMVSLSLSWFVKAQPAQTETLAIVHELSEFLLY